MKKIIWMLSVLLLPCVVFASDGLTIVTVETADVRQRASDALDDSTSSWEVKGFGASNPCKQHETKGFDICPDAPAMGVLINFEFDQASLRPEEKQLLKAIAQAMLHDMKPGVIEIGGHADTQGGAAHNKQLAQKRADKVRDFLLAEGVGKHNLTTRSYGEDYPLCSNVNALGREWNRRVEFMRVETQDGQGKIIRQFDAVPAASKAGHCETPIIQ